MNQKRSSATSLLEAPSFRLGSPQFTGGAVLTEFSLPVQHGTIIPCDTIVVVSDKYERAVVYGGMPTISKRIVVNGREYPFHNNFALDGGADAFNKLPLNKTVILAGAEDVYEGAYVSAYREVNCGPSENVVGGCVVT
jgi:hypothetical protein